jgi:hypothetical protein
MDHHISQRKLAMKLSKLFHVLSVLLGLTGVVMWFVAILAWPAGVVRFGVTREIMLLCAILSLLTAIWLVISAMHHITLEKAGEIV